MAVVILLALAGLAPARAFAQQQDTLSVVQQDSLGTRQDSLLAAMRTAYQELDYEQTRASANQVLAYYDQMTTEQLIEVHTTLAVVSYSTEDEEGARRHFEAALTLSPDLRLDPVAFSPKTLSLFEEVKAARLPPPEPEEAAAPVQYVTLRDPIPQAALRSVLLPGWGQLYKGHRGRGRVVAGAWGATAAGTALAHVRYRNRLAAYRDAPTMEEADLLYDSYNRWYKVRNNAALAAAGVWLYAYLDALLSQPPSDGETLSGGIQASPAAPADGPAVYVRLTF